MKRTKQPTRVQLAEHIDSMVDALNQITTDVMESPRDIADEALKEHAAWVKKSFL